jgi:hypothetical protein
VSQMRNVASRSICTTVASARALGSLPIRASPQQQGSGEVLVAAKV